MMGTAMFTMFTLYQAYNMFDNKIVGKLPFEPWTFVHNMSHKGVPGEDSQEYGLVFIYLMSTTAFRGMIGKITGSEGPRMPLEQ